MISDQRWGLIRRAVTASLVLLWAVGPVAQAAPPAWERHDVNLRVAAGLRILAIHTPQKAPLQAENAPQTLATEQPIPIDGFMPYVAIALTNKSYPGEFQFAHVLANSVIGTPLHSPLSDNYAIGILDTGGTVNVVGQCDRDVLGVTEAWLTGNTITVGGAGGEAEADITQPLGMFLAGLQAIDPTTSSLDTTKLVGHWNVSAAIPQEIACGDIVDIPTTIGSSLVAFRDVWIRNDHKRTVVRNGHTYTGPEVGVYVPGDPAVPSYPTVVPLDPRPGGLTTSAYFPALMDLQDFRTPGIPTALAALEGDLPTGGWFVASVWLKGASSGEINKYFMVDTGAQISLVRSFVAGQLGLNPAAPEFTVEVTGVAGEVTTAPGFYLDSLKIDAFGGPITFTQVPIIILDVPSVEGGLLDGIIGTNVFFNRNLAFKPNLQGSSVIEISGPIPRYGDFDSDGDVDLVDFAHFRDCFNGSNRPPAYTNCLDADTNSDGDIDLLDFALFRACFNGSNNPARCL